MAKKETPPKVIASIVLTRKPRTTQWYADSWLSSARFEEQRMRNINTAKLKLEASDNKLFLLILDQPVEGALEYEQDEHSPWMYRDENWSRFYLQPFRPLDSSNPKWKKIFLLYTKFKGVAYPNSRKRGVSVAPRPDVEPDYNDDLPPQRARMIYDLSEEELAAMGLPTEPVYF